MFGPIHANTEFSTIRQQVKEQLEDRQDTSCVNPVPITHYDTRGAVIEYTWASCRKCTPCQVRRQNKLAMKAAVEYWRAPKTWFITLTHTSIPWYDKVIKEWKYPKALDETFCHVTEEPDYSDVQKFMKRLRKKHDLRYVICEEEGAEHGRTHWHLLLYCHDNISARQIKRNWPYGNANCRLATDPHCGHYIAKYVAKNGRLRMSQNFGKTNYVFDDKGSEYTHEADLYERSGEKTGILSAIPDEFIRLGDKGVELTTTGIQWLRANQTKQGNGSLDHASDIPW